jgi:Fur family transcriptional regulator, ferric uptake regulator
VSRSAPLDDAAKLDALLQALRARGQRVTVARRAVLEQLIAAGASHLGAEQLAERVHEHHPTIHLSTIYRTLDSLDDAGLIHLARLPDQPAAYHLTDDVHHHALCTSCGRVVDVPPSMLDPLVDRLRSDYDFRADPHHLTIDGVCGNCERSARRSRRSTS